MTRKVVSIKKLKEDLHLERMVQYFLKRYSDDLDEYVYTRKKVIWGNFYMMYNSYCVVIILMITYALTIYGRSTTITITNHHV